MTTETDLCALRGVLARNARIARRSGSDIEAALIDACIKASLALQHCPMHQRERARARERDLLQGAPVNNFPSRWIRDRAEIRCGRRFNGRTGGAKR